MLIEEVDDEWPLSEADLKKVEFTEVGSSQREKRNVLYLFMDVSDECTLIQMEMWNLMTTAM